MAFREQLTITMAPSGAGKTFVRCAKFLATEFLPNEKGVSYSNFPIHLDKFIEYFDGKMEPEEVERRLQEIPLDELKRWEAGESGPWEYFKGVDYQAAHIQIDEAHLYIGDSTKNYRQWRDWLVAVRHGKGTVEFITQAPENLPQKIVKLAGNHIYLMDTQSTRDPFFKIQTSDWFELKAKFTGKYVSYFLENIRKKMFGVYITQASKYHARDPRYFALYDSYNTVGNVEGSEGEPEHEFQKRSLFGLLRWFYLRNFWTLTLRGVGSVIFLALILSLPKITEHVMASFKKHQAEKMAEVAKRQGKPIVPKGQDKFGNPNYWPKPKLDPEKVKDMQAEMIEMDRVIRQQASDYHKLKGIHEKMVSQIVKAKQANDLIGILFHDKAVTVGGRTVTVGDILNTLEGEKTIKGFDYDSSKIYFTDNTDAWVTIGQRRLQDAATVPTTPANEQAVQRVIRAGGIEERTGSPGGRGTRHLPGDRSTSVIGHQRDSTASGRDNHRDSRPAIYSRYVGSQQTAD